MNKRRWSAQVERCVVALLCVRAVLWRLVAMLCVVAALWCVAVLVGGLLESLAHAQTSNVVHIGEDERALQAVIDDAASAFAARRFDEARVLFENAAKRATELETKRELVFNAGVCAFERADYFAAEAHFVEASHLAPANAAGRFLVHAGLAALRRGDVNGATDHLARAKEEASSALATELRTQIERVRSEQERQARTRAVNAHLAESERARQASDWEAEREALTRALELAPGLVDLNVALGASLMQSGHYRAAEQTLQRALGLSLGPKARSVAVSSLDALYPVPQAGVRVGLGLSGGVDTNAYASPAAERRGVFTQGGENLEPALARISSILTKAEVNVAYSWRWSRQWALVPALSVQSAWYARPAVRKLSLTTTDLGLALYHAPSVASQLSAGVGSTLLLLDWPPKTPFLSDVYAEVGGLFRLSRAWATLFSVRAAPAWGYGRHRDLSGGSLAVQLGGQLRTSIVTSTLMLSGFASRAGKQNIPAAETFLPACSASNPERPVLCERAYVEVPLSYFKPEIGLDVQVTPWKPLLLTLGVRAFSRRFGDPSVVRVEPDDVALPASEKVRRDRALELRLGVEYFPTDTRSWSLFTQHSLLAHRSNLSPDAEVAEHRFDYENHNYNKFVAQVGVRVNFW